jgi:hypothetical protein
MPSMSILIRSRRGKLKASSVIARTSTVRASE